MLKRKLRQLIEKLRRLLDPKTKRRPVVAGSLRCTIPSVYDDQPAKASRWLSFSARALLTTFPRPWGQRRGI